MAYWGSEGAAVLSLPTKEYFQSSGWVEERDESDASRQTRMESNTRSDEFSSVQSVRSGSDFWAGNRTPGSSDSYTTGGQSADSHVQSHEEQKFGKEDGEENDNDSQGTEVPEGTKDDVVDEVGAQDAFVAGMIYSMSRSITPGAPYTPSAGGGDVRVNTNSSDAERSRWRLDECLK